MPRNRRQIDREEKVDAILAVAERQLSEGGLDALSVAAIARELGVAQNAVYWYFPSRAHLFVAALRRMLHAIAARKPRRQQGLERILWWTDQFASLYRFRAALQQLASEMEVVAEFVRELDGVLDRMASNALRERVSDDDLPAAVASFRAMVTGTYAEALSRKDRHRLVTFWLERLSAVPAQARL
jgi:TetR/AcrR family transcriptional regulator, repressor of the mexAB-oprM multidrug resistance operon